MVSCNSLSQAQKNSDNTLTHLSTTVRSDGKGQVVRFHLLQQADSFRVYQPEPHLIQVALFGNKIGAENLSTPSGTPIFDDAKYYSIPQGLGMDLQLKQKYFFDSNIYRDAQSDDILLSLTNTKQEALAEQTKGRTPINWSDPAFPAEDKSMASRQGRSSGNSQVQNKLKFDTVILDPGHGGHDTGAIGYGNKEKDIVLSISKKVGGYIEENMPGVSVVYTRDDDTFIELEERGSIANRHSGDLFVSIHANSSTSRQPHGTEVYFLGLERSQSALEVMKRENKVVRPNSDNDQKKLSQEELLIYELANSGYISSSERIAGMISRQFDERAQRRSRGVKQARFVVLYHASMPAILVETGFISNRNESKYLASDYGQSIIASAIFRAIRNYKQQAERSRHLRTK